MTQFPEHEYTYSHRNDPGLLSDIPNLGYQTHIPCNPSDGIVKVSGTTYINTWYGQQEYRFMNVCGISFDTLYCVFDDVYTQVFNTVQSNNLIDVFPSIDYTKFELSSIHEWLSERQGTKKILVENGNCLSGQSENFDMSRVVVKLAEKHPSKIFLTSAPVVDSPANVIYCGDVTKKQHDLNEISYLSTHCDMLIGRASAISSFCMTQNNLFHSKKQMLMFSNLEYSSQFWLSKLFQDKIRYTANITTYKDTNLDTVQRIIESYL
jgi:hypothetical protein